MAAATGDLRNNLVKVQSELKNIHYDGPLDVYGISKGDPAAFLPLIHFILLDYSHVLVQHFATRSYELYGKKDTRFMEAVYRVLRDEFGYKPRITRDQFFSMGFAEQKLIFVGDLIRLCKTLHANLSRFSGRDAKGAKEGKVERGRVGRKENPGSSKNIEMNDGMINKREWPNTARHADSWPPPSRSRDVSPLRASLQSRLSREKATLLPKSVAMVQRQHSPEQKMFANEAVFDGFRASRATSPERAQKAAPVRPLSNPNDSFHHQYHDQQEDAGNPDVQHDLLREHSAEVYFEPHALAQNPPSRHMVVKGAWKGQDSPSSQTRRAPTSAFSKSYQPTGTGANPPHKYPYLRGSLRGGQFSTDRELTATAPFRRTAFREPDVELESIYDESLIHEPAPPPAPAPQPLPPEPPSQISQMDGHFSTDVISPRPILKSPTRRTEYNHCFGSGNRGMSPSSPTKTFQWRDSLPDGNGTGNVVRPLSMNENGRKVWESGRTSPFIANAVSWKEAGSSAREGVGRQPSPTVQSRGWVAPTAPPVQQQPTVPQTSPGGPSSGLDLKQLFHDVRQLAAKNGRTQSDVEQLCQRLNDLESCMHGLVDGLSSRVRALEMRNRTDESNSLNVDTPSLAGRNHATNVGSQTESVGVSVHGKTEMRPNAGPSVQSPLPPAVNTSEREIFSETSAIPNGPTSSAAQRPESPRRNASHETAKSEQDKGSPPFDASQSLNSRRVDSPATLPADEYIRSIEARMRQTSQFLRERTRALSRGAGVAG
ncbi:Centrosomal protein of 44 kDa [Borealophlyctis nickersoniae]|nr:Centrosomal protein of 44 kDa [Borealophlyctis nickersoniae]